MLSTFTEYRACRKCLERKKNPQNETLTKVVPSDKPPHAYKKICVGCGKWISWVGKDVYNKIKAKHQFEYYSDYND